MSLSPSDDPTLSLPLFFQIAKGTLVSKKPDSFNNFFTNMNTDSVT